MKNQSDLIRINPNQVFNPKRSELGLIRINPNHSNLGFFRINSDWIFDLDQYDLGSLRIENLVWIYSDWIGFSQIDFWPFFIKWDTKRFSDWFGMIRIGSDTEIELNRNNSDWLGINSYPKLSTGISKQKISESVKNYRQKVLNCISIWANQSYFE